MFEYIWLILCLAFLGTAVIWITKDNPIKRWFSSWGKIMEQGFPDEEVCDLDYTIAKFVLPRLKRLAEISVNGVKGFNEAWLEDLDDMIYAMENIVAEYDDPHFVSNVSKQLETKHGCKVFGERFRELWS